MPTPLQLVRQEIIACERCPRLRAYCQRIAREKRAAYRNDVYWAKPVPGFGDPNARVLVLGLAPAAHGANRTGRNFTGDGGGGSGDFLMAAMHACGFASIPTSQSINDGLELRDAWIAAAVRCAPPDNKPTPGEIANCHPHLVAELDALPHLKVWVALGRIAFDAALRLIAERLAGPEGPALHSAARHSDGGPDLQVRPNRPNQPNRPKPWKKKPVFEHGAVIRIPGAPVIVCAYHPSRQNTNTGRLTAPMLKDAFRTAKRLAG